MGFSWQFWLIYTLLNCGPGWYLVYKRRRYTRPELANQDKYKPFFSLDDPNAHFSYVLVLFTHFFLWPRFIIGWLLFFTATGITALLLSVGEGHLNGRLPNWKLQILYKSCGFAARIAMFFCGLLSAKRVRVDFDYRKWLGPDWVKTYEGTSMCITNH